MGLSNFEIIYDNPNKTYSPGDTISGRVIIEINSVKRLTAIRIKYKGRSKTDWSKRHGKSSTYYKGRETYFEELKFLDRQDDPFELQPGKHTYEFTFALPAELPSSFIEKQATVKYAVKVTIDRPWKFDHNVKNEFFITQLLDLNELNLFKEPAALTIERNFCWLFKTGNVTVRVKVPCTGYICGQGVPLIVSIDNESNVSVLGLKLKLKKFKLALAGFHTAIKGWLPVMIGHVPLNYITPIEELNSVVAETQY